MGGKDGVRVAMKEFVSNSEQQALITLGIKNFICEMCSFSLEAGLMIGSHFIVIDLSIHWDTCAILDHFKTVQVVFGPIGFTSLTCPLAE